jgi:uncharacterized coiled-coil protein SlyX
MEPAADQQIQHLETEARPPDQDVGAASGAAETKPLGSGMAAVPVTAEQVLSSAEVVKAATKALSTAGTSGRGAGSSFSSGLMIDGFLVPPHVLQALQELRLQAGRSPGAAPPQPALQDIAAAPGPQAAATSNTGLQDPTSGQDQAADDASADAAGSSPNGAGPVASPPSSDAAIQDSCGSTPRSSSSGRGRGPLAGYSSRGSSRSSGRYSVHSVGSGRSSGSGRSGLSGRGVAADHASGLECESDEHVQSLEAAVAELSTRSAANAAVISQLNTDIISLSTTNETLRQRLLLLTGQLRHRDVEIDKLRTDVRRLRSLMAGPIDNKSSRGSNSGSRAR